MGLVTLTIDGMSCGHCVGRVRKALETLDGVEVETVEVGQAEVRIDEARQPLAAVVAALEAAGYPARPR
jgi:copper chaperone CopZ